MTNEEFLQSITLPGEEWREVVGSDGRYVVSSIGRVAALSFPYYQGEYLCFHKQKIKKQSQSTYGYSTTNVIIHGKSHRYAVHRLVATAFLANPDNLPCINHKDENKKNNHVDNLEWCTYQYNVRYGKQYIVRATKSKKDLKYRKPIVQLTINGERVKIHRSIYYAVKETGISKTCIKRCLNKRYHTAGGYKWIYLPDYESQVSMSKNSK